MPNTYVDYTGDNTTTSFAFPFPYLDDTHVVVQLDTVALAGGKFVDQTVTTHYTIQTSPSAAIIFVTAPATGDRIRIKRDSASDIALVDFENGSVLTEVELDRAYLHNLYLNEEIEEGSGKNTMTKDPVDGHYDADLAKIKNLADPTNPQDAVTKNYADTTFVDEAGDTMTGNLDMGSNKVTSSAVPSAGNDLTNKTYVDGQDALQVTKTGDSMSGALTLPATDPTNGNHAARKSYVDSQIAATLATGTAGGPIDTVNIADAAITTDKIDDDAITADKLANTAVTPGSYTATDLTVDAQGRITAAASGSASPTAAEVKTLYESNANTNEYDDAEQSKLAGIAAGAQVNPTNTDGLTQGSTNLYNQTHTGDVTGSTALTIADNAVTAAKISSTDTTFNVGTNVGIGAVASGNYKLEVVGDIAAKGAGNKFVISHSTDSVGYLQIHSGGQATNKKTARVVAFDGKLQLAWVNDDGSAGFVTQLNQATGGFEPNSDNAQSLGSASKRWSVVYAGTGTINTSDRNSKEEIQDLSDAELRVAQACKGLVKRFKFKGGTRKHIGVIAQDVRDAFSAEGLDAHEYGLFCSDTWTDEDTGEEVTQLGIRYEELLAFIISAL